MLYTLPPRDIVNVDKGAFKLMVTFFAIFSVADIWVTNLGISIGCVELNSFVLAIGLELWGIFRIGALGYLVLVFFLGYRYCYKHSIYRALTALKIGLLAVDIYIMIVVVSNICVLLEKWLL